MRKTRHCWSLVYLHSAVHIWHINTTEQNKTRITAQSVKNSYSLMYDKLMIKIHHLFATMCSGYISPVYNPICYVYINVLASQSSSLSPLCSPQTGVCVRRGADQKPLSSWLGKMRHSGFYHIKLGIYSKRISQDICDFYPPLNEFSIPSPLHELDTHSTESTDHR